MANTLYLFTGVFPYSQYTECFLEDEILYLSRVFKRIVIVPTRGDIMKREVPSNCVTTTPIFPSNFLFLLKGVFNIRTFSALINDFNRNKVYTSRKKLGVWVKGTLVINNLLNSKVIRNIEKEIDESDVCYYYWGKWSNLLTLFMRKKCHHISRFHGAWDLWEDEFDDYAPLRKELSARLDKAVFISRMGEDYFKRRYPQAVTSFNPLGSIDYGIKRNKTKDDISIVSCSTVYPLKRVDLIFRSIRVFAERNENKTIVWTHMGGGATFEELKLLVRDSPRNMCVKLLGNLDHTNVIDTYKNNSFDLFINLSTNEGVPVSIMEAISFDIPVIATNVGGNSEIARDGAGLLTSANPSPLEVADRIADVLERNNTPRLFWESNYNANKNYSDFANILINMSRL